MKIQTQNQSWKGNKAFTIAEVVVSTVIIAIGAAALMSCFSLSFLIMQMARENQRATQIMLEKAEAIRLCSWDQVNTAGFVPSTFTDYYDPTATNGAYGTVYTGSCVIASFPDNSASYSTNMRMLTVSVRWRTKTISRARTNITYIARDGVQNYVY